MKLCDYGCGQKAKHQFKNGKWCCSSITSKCPEVRKKLSISLKGHKAWNKGKHNIYSKETLEKMKHSHLKDKNYWFGKNLSLNHKLKIGQSHKGKQLSEKTKKKLSKVRKGNTCAKGIKYKSKVYTSRRLSISKIQEKYPFFAKVEEMRYNPDKPGEREIQVHCKNHICKNSKEKAGWFTPTRTQLHERIRNLENPLGTEGSYFYCSEKCKNECFLYNLHSDPFKKNKKRYTSEEYQTFRQFVLERDKYVCQYCADPATEVHHIRPQKLEPFFALDPDYAISVCKDCHYKYGHKDECNTGELASKLC